MTVCAKHNRWRKILESFHQTRLIHHRPIRNRDLLTTGIARSSLHRRCYPQIEHVNIIYGQHVARECECRNGAARAIGAVRASEHAERLIVRSAQARWVNERGSITSVATGIDNPRVRESAVDDVGGW